MIGKYNKKFVMASVASRSLTVNHHVSPIYSHICLLPSSNNSIVITLTFHLIVVVTGKSSTKTDSTNYMKSDFLICEIVYCYYCFEMSFVVQMLFARFDRINDHR